MRTVRYIDLAPPLRLGEPARVLCLDHPSPLVLARHWARTSPVKAIQYRSRFVVEFWTLHTHYVPVDTDPMPGEVMFHEADI